MTTFTVAIFCLSAMCPIPKEGIYRHLEAQSRQHCEALAGYIMAGNGFNPHDFIISCAPAVDL